MSICNSYDLGIEETRVCAILAVHDNEGKAAASKDVPPWLPKHRLGAVVLNGPLGLIADGTRSLGLCLLR